MNFGNVDPATLAAEALPTTEGRGTGHAPLINYATQNVPPPSNLYVTINDSLQVTLSGLGFFVCLLELRTLLPNGSIAITEEQFQSPGTKAPASFQFRLTEGFLLSVAVFPKTGQPTRGSLFAIISLIRGQAAATATVYSLTHGYIGQLSPLFWPSPRTDVPTAGAGMIQQTVVTNPAAGADWIYQTVALTRQRIQSISAQLVTSAVVANRQVQINLPSGAISGFIAPSPSVQPASTTFRYSFVPGLNSIALLANLVVVPLPPNLVVNFSQTIRTNTTLIDAGDQWQNIVVLSEDWLDA
jgi:hypothetical protein